MGRPDQVAGGTAARSSLDTRTKGASGPPITTPRDCHCAAFSVARSRCAGRHARRPPGLPAVTAVLEVSLRDAGWRGILVRKVVVRRVRPARRASGKDLSMNADDTLYGRIKNRVLTISGNSPSIRVDGGCLVVSDGPMPVPANHCGAAPPANERMAVLRLPRAGCPVDRIVVTRPDGFVTFGAIRWLHGVGCALVQLDWYGTVLLATAPAGPDRPAIRRAQALAAGDKNGLAIMREILRC